VDHPQVGAAPKVMKSPEGGGSDFLNGQNFQFRQKSVSLEPAEILTT
jgi:hypothetical protein